MVPSLDLPAEDKGKAKDKEKNKEKEKSPFKIEREPSSSSGAASAHVPPPSHLGNKSKLRADLEHLLNEPFDERKREEILEKIRTLPLSNPVPVSHHKVPFLLLLSPLLSFLFHCLFFHFSLSFLILFLSKVHLSIFA